MEALEDRRLLSATLSYPSSQSIMVFNAVQNNTSQTETLTLTDTGDAALSLNSISIINDPNFSAQDASRFSITNASSIPASLSPGQSFTLQMTYKPNVVGIQSALLDMETNDGTNPSQQIALRGLGAVGIGGTNQPSLATILQAWEIPTYVGEGFDDQNASTDVLYPAFPDSSTQEVVMPRLVAATDAPVTIQVLASYTASGTKPYTLGTYVPGNPNDRSELFFTPSSEYQSTYVQPDGATTFDPGSASFG